MSLLSPAPSTLVKSQRGENGGVVLILLIIGELFALWTKLSNVSMFSIPMERVLPSPFGSSKVSVCGRFYVTLLLCPLARYSVLPRREAPGFRTAPVNPVTFTFSQGILFVGNVHSKISPILREERDLFVFPVVKKDLR